MDGIPEAKMSENAQNVNRTIGTEKKRVKYCLCGCGRIVKRRYVKYHFIPTNRIHGDHLSKLYALWRNIRYRCKCSTSKDYLNYGRRGISVCKEWDGYQKFKNWAVSNNYQEGLTIERKNTNEGYNPKNCIFTTIAKNNKNKTTGYWWFIYGKRFESSSDAADFWGVTAPTIFDWCGLRHPKNPNQHCYRIKRYGNN